MATGRGSYTSGLEHEHLLGTEAQGGPTRRVAGEARWSGLTDDIDRVGVVLHPQRDPQVGVGTDVVAQDPEGRCVASTR